MKTGNYRNIISLIIFSSLIFTGCKKDKVQAPPVVIPDASVVNKFIWNGMHDYYLWSSQIPNLSEPKFGEKDTLNLLLNRFTDPQVLFTSLLYQYNTIDKWSFMVDNSQTITDWISGTSKTAGYDYMLARIDQAGNLIGFIRYVYKNSPAEKAGLKRGNLFLKVNDQSLTISNYQTLLAITDTYKLGFANITNGTIAANNLSATLTPIEMQEDPINKDTIFVYNNQKIGYLVYNGFNSDFDLQLNNVIKTFKDANIDQMVLDLRYNGGGSVQSSTYLASMLYGTDVTKVFASSQYNAGFQAAIAEQSGSASLNYYFANTIIATATTSSAPINTLNLQKIYIIVSDNTASASELLINGLRPYMNVKVVGINTVGKYVGSMTIEDWIDNNGTVNPKDPYAMQPIVVKFANKDGVTDFINGLTPDIVASEFSQTGITADELTGILPFGDPNEKLLKYVLADISGIPITAQTFKSGQIGMKKVMGSHDLKPFATDMYINPVKIKSSGLK